MLVLFAMLVVLINLAVILYMFSLMSKSPFISVPKKYLPEIVNALDLKEDSVLYDLGSGDGRVLFAARAARPAASFIGIDKNFAPIIVSRFKKLLHGNPGNVRFKRANLFKADFSKATHVFTYLFDGPMAELWPVMLGQLKPGTIVVSCNFKFPVLEQKQLILGHLSDKSARKLYIYEIPRN